MDVDQWPLLGDSPILDFLNTVDTPDDGHGVEIDYLANYGQAAQLCERAQLISSTLCEQLLQASRRHPVRTARTFEDLVILRDELRVLFLSLAKQTIPSGAAISLVNFLIRESAAHRTLVAPDNKSAGTWRWQTSDTFVNVLPWEIALHASRLLCDAQRLARLKVCANDPCRWLFLDYSRNGKRRWCSMAECGTAAKVKLLREKRRSQNKL